MNSIKIDISLEREGFSFGVNETFEKGITGIFGHSGAGKTTLLQCLSGVITPEKGSISIGDRLLYSCEKKINIKTYRRHIGYVFQEGRLFPHYNIRKNLKYGFRFLRGRKRQVGFDDVVSILDLGRLLDHYPSELSGGERQRVALGRALLAAPEALLLDEPFSALDQRLRQQIIPFISRISKVLEIPVLLVSHDLPDILKLSDRLCLLKDGNVCGHGLYSDLIKRQELFTVLPKSDIINMITLEVKKIQKEQGLIELNGFGAHRKVNMVFEPDVQEYHYGDLVKVFLRPNHIVLSTSEIGSSSFQNQLRGRIETIVPDGARSLCLVDCGFPVLAEVSNASVYRLQLAVNDEVYCMFKSLALDSITL